MPVLVLRSTLPFASNRRRPPRISHLLFSSTPPLLETGFLGRIVARRYFSRSDPFLPVFLLPVVCSKWHVVVSFILIPSRFFFWGGLWTDSFWNYCVLSFFSSSFTFLPLFFEFFSVLFSNVHGLSLRFFFWFFIPFVKPCSRM